MLFNRRSMFTAGAVTALALSTPQIMTRAAFAAAPPKSDITNTGFYRFMLGEFEITVILDGGRIFDGPHPTFGADRDADEVVSLMKANFLPSDRMIGQFNPVLVNTGTDLILFDTGNGPEGSMPITSTGSWKAIVRGSAGHDMSSVRQNGTSGLQATFLELRLRCMRRPFRGRSCRSGRR